MLTFQHPILLFRLSVYLVRVCSICLLLFSSYFHAPVFVVCHVIGPIQCSAVHNWCQHIRCFMRHAPNLCKIHCIVSDTNWICRQFYMYYLKEIVILFFFGWFILFFFIFISCTQSLSQQHRHGKSPTEMDLKIGGDDQEANCSLKIIANRIRWSMRFSWHFLVRAFLPTQRNGHQLSQVHFAKPFSFRHFHIQTMPTKSIHTKSIHTKCKMH